ncbi:MAG TPA: polyprenyl synthetase family protein [Ignavibacteria bacterium]|nr:polyprenyl synthetase family protein [Ignavibacteria bacterium]
MQNYQKKYDEYRSLVESYLKNSDINTQPASLYEPVRYVISGGGKRLRPLLTMLSAETFGGDINQALVAGAAIELLHNFTLVHDDIMDNANARRGRPTVHRKWNSDTAILAGDQLIAIAYDTLLNISSKNSGKILKVFTNAIIEVCEGQSYDKDFETQKNVLMQDYLMMITKKTAKLLEACTLTGGLIADASDEDLKNLGGYAINLGLAFQILDDLLDVTGDEKTFGKMTGGDIREGKKTYLYLKACELASEKNDKNLLLKIADKSPEIKEIEFGLKIKTLFERLGVILSAKDAVEFYTSEANKYLDNLSVKNTEQLRWFAGMLLNRKF